jgi:uracil-DNA glycosylase
VGEIVPPRDQVMRAFATDPKLIKVVLLGQDPYPTPGDANGLAFASGNNSLTPRSLRNIAKELRSDLGPELLVEASSPNLTKWIDQGVMLLNRALTTAPGVAGAHLGKEYSWQEFTFKAVEALLQHQPVILLLFGKSAQSIAAELRRTSNLAPSKVVESAHPSPLSATRGFFHSKPFSRVNKALMDLGIEPIDWSC